MPNLEIAEVVLVHRNIVNNEYQHHLRILYTFVYICIYIYIYIYIYISLGKSLDISSKKLIAPSGTKVFEKFQTFEQNQCF